MRSAFTERSRRILRRLCLSRQGLNTPARRRCFQKENVSRFLQEHSNRIAAGRNASSFTPRCTTPHGLQKARIPLTCAQVSTHGHRIRRTLKAFPRCTGSLPLTAFSLEMFFTAGTRPPLPSGPSSGSQILKVT
ncbi:hypothetical protein SKAU_G00183250 [Synaphobranchus kaupii]|uniref:Uncharacterized protein n=1 Tax=Synaphobranchus kaupii TaxID=118154 RepID=A0A9Q1FBY4_SYNKA|nr:hypothetical protein SKAU_G00183250 [Synaphobranchus kaupii]